MKYLIPAADLTFKRVFGEHPVCALSFVNEISEREIDTWYHHYTLVHRQNTGKERNGKNGS